MTNIKNKTEQCENCKKEFEATCSHHRFCSKKCRRYVFASQNIVQSLIYSAKYRAKKNNIEFNITKEDLILPKYCPILDIELKRSQGNLSGKYNSYSLDRIDPKKGYIKGNVHIISWRANEVKNNSTLAELEKITKWMRNNDKKINKRSMWDFLYWFAT